MTYDEDGMARYDLVWTIQGRNSDKLGKLYGLHDQELRNAKAVIQRLARKGDTVDIQVI